MLTIYHAPGARSLRIVWLCEEMGVPYKIGEASLRNPSEEFKALNPLHTVPVITDGETTMIESIAIMIYIMNQYGPTSVEVRPGETGYPDYLQFLLFGEAGLAAYGNPLVATKYLAPDDQKDNFTARYLRDAITRRLEFIASHLAGRPYLAASRFTAADISVAYVIGVSKLAGIEEIIPPALLRYYADLMQRPAFQRAAAVK